MGNLLQKQQESISLLFISRKSGTDVFECEHDGLIQRWESVFFIPLESRKWCGFPVMLKFLIVWIDLINMGELYLLAGYKRCF